MRAARALLGIFAVELAQLAKIGHRTLQRFEGSDGIPNGRTSVLATIQKALEAQGIMFTGDPVASQNSGLAAGCIR